MLDKAFEPFAKCFSTGDFIKNSSLRILCIPLTKWFDDRSVIGIYHFFSLLIFCLIRWSLDVRRYVSFLYRKPLPRREAFSLVSYGGLLSRETMDYLKKYTLFLFDFDGLLVNTEHLHFEAYRLMCKNRGFALSWDFTKFCSIAHKDDTGLQKQIYAELPSLHQMESNWSILYAEKKAYYQSLLQEGNLSVMPGVETMLSHLASLDKKRCVVTNSTRTQIDLIKERLAILQTIPHWFTREDYQRSKPAPDGYLKALSTLSTSSDTCIGFEDTLRGYTALQRASIPGIVISSVLSEEMRQNLLEQKAEIYSSFTELL